ncbi:unnamed protein product [Haemonchus placei]|uniref:CPSF_A domain-containing protein n=1 Tax=Haemonchus placei TaxID=6290 RepID=A0A0N4WLA9_HAEPC|nr:unnamed protein product [Haemonchus placei]
MYSYLNESDDSTTVNFSSYGKFLPGKGNQLLTIGAKHLRLFRTNPYTLIPPKDATEEWKQKTKLECVYSCRFMAPVQSFAKAKLPGYPASEALLLAFEGCNVSVVAIDAEDRALSTISLHSFLSEFKRDGFTHHFHEPIVRTDPANRCGAVIVYDRILGILPFDGEFINSFSIPLSDIDHRLENIVDIIFLDGYYEPTLLFLYEPHQTTAGRASVRYDTMHLLGVSVNVFDEQVAIVWQVGSLPMDCNRLVAIPKPLGGVLVIGSNEVIYLNQSVPPCGISLNSCYDNFTKFPLKDLKNMSMTLDAGPAEWIGNNRVALGTMDGRLFVLKLVTDSSETVRSLTLDHVFDTSIAYCMTLCASGRLFIGSRLGDSQLLEFSIEKEESEISQEAKRPKVEQNLTADDEDIELYGEQIIEQVATLASDVKEKMVFRELDKLVNIGPIRAMTAGGAHGIGPILQEQDRTDPIFDVITASGNMVNGSICVLQRTVRPDVITSSFLQDAQQLWAVGRREDDSHKYLIVSRTRSSLILELGEDMVELEEPLFLSDEPTVAAGELADGGLAVQVTSLRVALVAEEQQLQQIDLDSNFPVVAASIVDPYVALLTQNGRLMLYQLVLFPNVHLQEIDLSGSAFAEKTVHHRAPLTALSIYRDMSGLMIFSDSADDFYERRTTKPKKVFGEWSILITVSVSLLQKAVSRRGTADSIDIDLYGEEIVPQMPSTAIDEDELLYGDSGSTKKGCRSTLASSISFNIIPSLADEGLRKRKRMAEITSVTTGGEESDAIDPNTVEPTYWLILARDSGKVVIHSLPDMRVVYQFLKFGLMPELVTDLMPDEEEKDRKEQGMGINQGHPTLLAVIDDQVITYELYKWRNPLIEHLAIGFRRLPLTVTIRSAPFMGHDGRRAEMHGVVLTGAFPCLVLVGAWGGLQCHPMTIDGPISAFTAFNNQNVPNGFLYIARNLQELRIARLQGEVDYELPFPSRKVPIGATVHHVRYIMNSQVYVVTTSVPMKSNKIWVVVNDDKQVETHEKNANFVLPSIPQYTLNLYSAMDWKPVPNTDIKFEEMEVVTACEEVTLRSESTISGMQAYLAVGTINNYGEEVLVRGRIILAEIIDVVPEPGKPTSKHKIKVFIWGFRDNDLQGISFLDMHYYVHSLVSIRNLAIACDMHDSMSLIRFQEQFKALSVASRDDRPDVPSPMAAQFLVDNNHLAFLMSDEAGNISMFNYMPETQESNGGERLILRGVLNIGTNVNSWLRIRGHSSLFNVTPVEAKHIMQQQTCLWASLDGSLGIVRPISERQFRRLHFLHQCMSNSVGQYAGLNPKGARGGKPVRPLINATNNKNMVDGELVEQFMHLSTTRKQDLARSLGASRYHIMDDLVQIQRLSTFY